MDSKNFQELKTLPCDLCRRDVFVAGSSNLKKMALRLKIEGNLVCGFCRNEFDNYSKIAEWKKKVDSNQQVC